MKQEKEKAQSEQKTVHVETWPQSLIRTLPEDWEEGQKKFITELLNRTEKNFPLHTAGELAGVMSNGLLREEDTPLPKLHKLEDKCFLFEHGDSNSSMLAYQIYFPETIQPDGSQHIGILSTGSWTISITDGNGGRCGWSGTFGNREEVERFMHLLQSQKYHLEKMMNWIQIYN